MEKLKIAVLGPSEPEKTFRILGVNYGDLISIASKVGKIISEKGHHLVVCPDGGNGYSIAYLVAKSYKNSGGEKVLGVVPRDNRWGYSRLNFNICDELVECNSWGDVPVKLVEIADRLIVLGLSPGTMIELCWGKWMKKKFYIVKRYVSGVPPEIASFINLDWVDSIDELESKLEMQGS
jgi:predicted Rossmann-fold nucleotide-binding protein